MTTAGVATGSPEPTDIEGLLTIRKEEIEAIHATYHVPKELRPTGWKAFFARQAGAPLEYYTHDEANTMALLGATKVISASMASFALSKALKGIAHIPDELHNIIGSGLTATAETGILVGIFATAYTAVSKLDTIIMRNMRHDKTARQTGHEDRAKGSWGGASLRAAIVGGSAMITVPWALVAANEKTIDQIINPPLIAVEQQIRTEYQGKLKEVDGRLSAARGELDGLIEAQATGGRIMTAGEQSDSQVSRTEVGRLTSEIAKNRDDLAEANRKKDEQEAIMQQEAGGTLGAQEGQGPKFDDARQLRDNAQRDVVRLQAERTTLETSLRDAQARVSAIESGVDQRFKSQGNAARSSLEVRVDNAQEKVAELEAERAKAANIDLLVDTDSRYQDPDDTSLSKKFLVYLEYANKNPLEYLNIVALSLIFAAFELSAMLSAAGVRVSTGEMNEFFATLAAEARLREKRDRNDLETSLELAGLRSEFASLQHEAVMTEITRADVQAETRLNIVHAAEMASMHREQEIDATEQQGELDQKARFIKALEMLQQQEGANAELRALQHQKALDEIVSQILSGNVPEHVSEEMVEGIMQVLEDQGVDRFAKNLRFDIAQAIDARTSAAAPAADASLA